MSDLDKESTEILPPKPKKVKTVKTKARRSVKNILARSRKKVAAAEQTLRSAKQSAEYLKDKYKNINSALNGKETQLIEQREIDTASSSVKEHLHKQDVIFKPNTGPQTELSLIHI